MSPPYDQLDEPFVLPAFESQQARWAQDISLACPQRGVPSWSLHVDPVMEGVVAHLKGGDAERPVAATVAVADACGLVYEQGYGSYGPAPGRSHVAAEKRPAPDTLFRIGSVAKPMAAAATHHLIDEGVLHLADRAFCPADATNRVIPTSQGSVRCWIPLRDLAEPGYDDRLHDVRIVDLLIHRGGWTGSPFLDGYWTAHELGVYGERVPEARDWLDWIVDQRLDGAPGTVQAYADTNYAVLGHVIEAATGRPFHEYLYDRVLAPQGIFPADVQPASTLPEDRDPREPWYPCGGTRPSPWPQHPADERICVSAGAEGLEGYGAAGGLVATAGAVATFYAGYWSPGWDDARTGMPRDDYLVPPPAPTYGGTFRVFDRPWGQGGRLAGAEAMAVQCLNGLNIAVLTNDEAGRPGIPWRALAADLCEAARREVGTQLTFTAAYVPAGHGPSPVIHAVQTQRELAATQATLQAQGLRPTALTAGAGTSVALYTTAWHPLDGPPWGLGLGLDEAALQQTVQRLDEQDATPVLAAAWSQEGEPRFALMWEQKAEQRWWNLDWGLDEQRLRTLISGLAADLRPSGPPQVAPYVDDGQARFVLLRSAAEDRPCWKARVGIPADSLRAEADGWSRRGYALDQAVPYETDHGRYYAAVFTCGDAATEGALVLTGVADWELAPGPARLPTGYVAAAAWVET